MSEIAGNDTLFAFLDQLGAEIMLFEGLGGGLGMKFKKRVISKSSPTYSEGRSV